MKRVALSNGGEAIVDDIFYPYIMEWKWVRSNYGYAQRGIKVNGRSATVLMHRLIMGAEKGQQIDHVNGDPLDNREANLRFSTQEQNLRNQKRAKNNKTGYKGVSAHGAKYRAIIMIAGKNRHLGIFKTAEEAANAYNVAAFRDDPEFSRLN